MADRLIPATSPFREDDRRRFQAVRRAITEHGFGLKAFAGVIDIRPGYRFVGGWISRRAGRRGRGAPEAAAW